MAKKKRKARITGSPEELRARATRCAAKAYSWLKRAMDFEKAARREEKKREDKLMEVWPKEQCETCKAGKECLIHDK